MRPVLKTAWGKEITVWQALKYWTVMMGLVCFAACYLLACFWVGTDYSYIGGWFMFLSAFMMPIRLNKNPFTILMPDQLEANDEQRTSVRVQQSELQKLW
jgi:hypothetical protein